MYIRPTLAFLAALALVACGDDAAGDARPAPAPGSLLADPLQAYPSTIAEVGLYPSAPDLTVVPSNAVAYAPAHPLWSSGSEKDRYVVLPEGAVVENTGEAWEFPVGTLFFKTFAYPRDGAQNPVETRLIQRTEEGWAYATYVWNDEGTEATLSDMTRPLRVDVTLQDGEPMTHTVPSTLQCRKCHESNRVEVLGFSELQLSEPDETGQAPIDAFYADGLLAHDPEGADRVFHEDPLTQEVLGYLAGNCTHCHNGHDGPSSSYDLRYTAALDALVGRSTQSSVSASGIRVIPGNPDESIVFEAVSHITDEPDIEFMPPVGIDRVDPYAVDLLRRWILALPQDPE